MSESTSASKCELRKDPSESDTETERASDHEAETERERERRWWTRRTARRLRSARTCLPR